MADTKIRNLKDAEEMSKKYDAAGREGFCPLIKDNCVIGCKCFVHSQIKESKDGEGTYYRVTLGYCVNPLISGIIEVEGNLNNHY